MKILFWILNLSALISVIYGIGKINPNNLWGTAIGFHFIGRASDLLISIGLINLAVLSGYHMESKVGNIIARSLIGVNTVLMLAAVVLMSRRGSYLGFFIGVLVLLYLLKKKKTIALVVIALGAFIFFSNSGAVQRVTSIVDFKGDHSTRERIQLLRTGSAYLIDAGLFFRGTGGKMSVAPFTKYFYSHSSEYQKENSDIIKRNYFGNFHNSFLQMAVEYGLLFLLSYVLTIGYLLVRLYRELSCLAGNEKVYPMAAIAATAGFFVSQFFHGDLYSYGGLPFVMVLTAGCLMINRYQVSEIGTGATHIAGGLAES